MAYNHEYPYVDPNRYNSDWELNKVKELEEEMKTFEALNKITFSGEWDITKQYPAWTVVNDNNGRDGYISIKPVPAGVTIDNTDYWRGVANYTDLIADLQNRVIALEGDLSLLTNRKYLFVGDSYAAGTIGSSWYTTVCSCLGLTDGVNAHLVAQDGAGFVNGYFQNLMENAGLSDADEITDIIIAGGMNDDTQTESDILTAIQAFVTSANVIYSNATIRLGAIGWRTSVENNTQEVKVAAAYKRAVSYGVGYLNNVEWALHRYDCFNTVYPNHPNATGSEMIGKALSNAIMTGAYDPTTERRDLTVTFNVTLTAQSVGSTYVQCQISGGTAVLSLESYAGRGLAFTVPAAATLSPTNPLLLFTLPDDTYIKGYSTRFKTQSVTLRDATNGTLTPAKIALIGYEVYLLPCQNYAVSTSNTYVIDCFDIVSPLGVC